MVLLRTFGGLSLASDEAALPPSATQRRRLALLVLLARSGGIGISRDKLCSYLWPEASAESARHALDQLLYATRRDLGRDAIVSDGGQLRLSSHVIRADCAEFDRHLEANEADRAVALYAGPFLDGVHLGGSPELERWVEGERGRLAARFHGALEALGRAAMERGDAEAAVGWWRSRVAAEPLDGRATLRLMEALAKAGDVAGAIRSARMHAVLVREELGATPDAEVQVLAERLASEPAPVGESVRTTGHPAPVTAGQSSPSAAVAPSRRAIGRGGASARRTERGRLAVRWAVVAVVAVGGVLWMRPRSAPAAHDPGPASVAVLPFQDLSARGAAEYLGDGLSEELIHALAQVPGLKVSARTSAFAFKGTKKDIRQIARALGVSTVVEGSVRQEGDWLRVTAQLIDAATGYHLWSGSFDRRAGDAIAIQDEIAHSLVRTLRPRLTREVVPARSTTAPGAHVYNLYLQGRYAMNARTEPSLRSAARLFEQAVAEDSSFAAAHAGLADVHDALADEGFAPEEPSYLRAEAAVRTAIRLDGTLAEAHATLGHLRFHRWDWTGAEQEFRRALELNSGYAGTYGRFAMPLVMSGRFDEGLAMMRRAQELDPLSLGTHNRMGWLLSLAGRYEEAIDQLRTVIAMDSTVASAHARLGVSLVETGRYEEGIAALERAVRLGGGYFRSSLPMLGYAYARAGRRADAERIAARVERETESANINPYYAAALMAALDRENRAFALLDHALATHRGCLVDVGVDPMMDRLRTDPRFTSILRELGVRVGR